MKRTSQELPDWLTLDSQAGTISGTLPLYLVGQSRIE